MPSHPLPGRSPFDPFHVPSQVGRLAILFLVFSTLALLARSAAGAQAAEQLSWTQGEGGIEESIPVPQPIPEMADTTDIVQSVSDTTLTIRPGGAHLTVPYYGNRSLGVTYQDVTRAILIVHGTLRNAGDYFHYVVEAGRMSGGADSTTMIIAPQYLTEADIHAHHLSSSYLYWAYMGWRKGDNSLSTLDHPRPAVISSFSVADTILLNIVAHLPNLRHVVVVGHSAGGQFSHFYTIGNQVDGVIRGLHGLDLRYVVANPSCYMYFDDRRWVIGTSYTFAVPADSVVAGCPGYNAYKFGLLHPNPYMSLGDEVLKSQYSSRPVDQQR